MTVRVRFAPSPTGYLHVGGARTALFNWLFARHHGGVFILRIEDTDQARNSWAAVEQILASMAWLGLAWDEGPLVGGASGPYFQTACLDLYRAEVDRLLATGQAYRCWCTPDELAAARDAARAQNLAPRYPGTCRDLAPDAIRAREASGKPCAIRFRVPPGQAVFRDLLRGEMRFENTELDDLVIMKSDGIPTYNFAVVIDDTRMAITHVIRGDDHLSNTPRQVLLYEALGYSVPPFVHVPQILGPDKTRLSKRHGATSVFEYRNEGILPAAMMCYLARLGWSFDDKTELFTTEELVRAFDIDGLNKTAAVFDREKLDWVNSRVLRAEPPAERMRLVLPSLIGAGLVPAAPDAATRAKLEAIVTIYGERMSLGPGAARDFEPFFREIDAIDPEVEQKTFGVPGSAERLSRLADAMEAIPNFDHDAVEAALRGLATAMGVKAKDLIHPSRLAVTGRTVGAGLFETFVVLGKETVVRRLRVAAVRAKTLEGATA